MITIKNQSYPKNQRLDDLGKKEKKQKKNYFKYSVF